MKWTHLEMVDRSDGEVERIDLHHEKAKTSVALAAEVAGLTISQAWAELGKGGTIATASFLRRLVLLKGGE